MIAEKYKLTICDSIYLALAIQNDCEFVVADEKFYKALTGTYPNNLRGFEDVD